MGFPQWWIIRFQRGACKPWCLSWLHFSNKWQTIIKANEKTFVNKTFLSLFSGHFTFKFPAFFKWLKIGWVIMRYFEIWNLTSLAIDFIIVWCNAVQTSFVRTFFSSALSPGVLFWKTRSLGRQLYKIVKDISHLLLLQASYLCRAGDKKNFDSEESLFVCSQHLKSTSLFSFPP